MCVCACMHTYVMLLNMRSSGIDHTLYIAISVIHEFHSVDICSQLPLFHGYMSGDLKDAVCMAG